MKINNGDAFKIGDAGMPCITSSVKKNHSTWLKRKYDSIYKNSKNGTMKLKVEKSRMTGLKRLISPNIRERVRLKDK